ncbi:hypothetical protein MD484_g9035, partial [Candolleomyces efflorescens]
MTSTGTEEPGSGAITQIDHFEGTSRPNSDPDGPNFDTLGSGGDSNHLSVPTPTPFDIAGHSANGPETTEPPPRSESPPILSIPPSHSTSPSPVVPLSPSTLSPPRTPSIPSRPVIPPEIVQSLRSKVPKCNSPTGIFRYSTQINGVSYAIIAYGT